MITVSAHFVDGIGVSEMNGAKNWFTVSPNPSNGIFNLIPNKLGGEPMTITVTDLTGRIILAPVRAINSGNIVIDLNHISNGIYQLTAERDGQHQNTKLIVED